MDDVLSALEITKPEVNEDGVLESFLRNARHILCTGVIAVTLLASVGTLQEDFKGVSSEPLTKLYIQTESMDIAHSDVLLKNLNGFQTLKEGWNNDELSKRIDDSVIGFLSKVISCSDPSDWQKWLVFPEQRGSVMLDYDSDNCRASISVGSDGFSYMAYGLGFYDAAEREGLSEGELLTFVRKVKEYGRSKEGCYS